MVPGSRFQVPGSRFPRAKVSSDAAEAGHVHSVDDVCHPEAVIKFEDGVVGEVAWFGLGE
ncbi:MAG TPA: hypothetical protein VJB15_04915 [Rhodothermia bacterium]|nr:hypothetical protein [Rhodothermia bacterium]